MSYPFIIDSPRPTNARACGLILVAALGLHAAHAGAQTLAGKTVVAEPTGVPTEVVTASSGPFVLFGQWIQRVAPPTPVQVISAPVTLLAFVTPTAPLAQPFEAAPVILGQPELPLLGQAAADAGRQWNSGLNYQGVTISYVVLDASGKKRELRPISKGLARGELFKIRYTTSFDAVASIDQVEGESAWTGQRIGQVWPSPGTSAQNNAGETVELPLDAQAYFKFTGGAQERYVLTIRHPKAKDAARSQQPAYRQDGVRGSQYLQLVPTKTFAAIEQVIAPRPQR